MIWLVMLVPMVLALAAVALMRDDDARHDPDEDPEPPCSTVACAGPVRTRRAAPQARERRAAHARRSHSL